MIDRWGRGPLAAVVGVPALLVLALLVGAALRYDAPAPTRRAAPPPTATAAPAEDETVPPAAPAPAGLPVIDYDPAPAGFPADPRPLDVTPLTEGLTPTRHIAAYDAPGGRPARPARPHHQRCRADHAGGGTPDRLDGGPAALGEPPTGLAAGGRLDPGGPA